MYGGGFSVMLLYSRVNCPGGNEVSAILPPHKTGLQGLETRTRFCAARLAMFRMGLMCREEGEDESGPADKAQTRK